MLTLQTTNGARDCGGLTRRDFVRAGMLGLGGLTLPWLLRNKALAAENGADYVRDKAVVMIFLSGGASHIETFNPNMDGPEPSRSVTGEVRTTLPGVTFGGTFPLLAQHAHKMAIVRCFRHPVGNHEQAIHHILTGGTDPRGLGVDGFSLGAMYARLRGTNHPRTGLPTYALLTWSHRDPQYRNEIARVLGGSRGGTLGPTCAPFTPTGGTALENITLNVPAERLADRRHLLGELNRLRRERDATGQGLDRFEQQAADLLLGGAGRALDLTREDRRVFERYDTRRFLCGKRLFDPSLLGEHLLLARRLIEGGAGFVTVQSAGWDMHADGNNPGIVEGMRMLGPPLDRALSAFLEDLEQRGLSDKVLVVLTGDFGRTPTINNRGGRDHWTSLCTLALIGGGLRMGQVIGQADRQNRAPVGTPISTPNLLATVMHTLFDVGTLRVARGVPVNLVRLIEEHRPIRELF
jgi:hypothetical protein